jgi:DNA-directed RNA polymerase specialized sigma24 family protein
MTPAESGRDARHPLSATADADAWTVPVRDADSAFTAIFVEHYRSLVNLATRLVLDAVTAEEVVRDSFAAMDVQLAS